MSDLANQILRQLCEQYQKTSQTEVHCDFPFSHRDQKAEIAQELQVNGYIRKYDFYGKATLRCTLTQKTLSLADSQ